MCAKHNDLYLESKVAVLHADRFPTPGEENSGPHKIYQNPRMDVEIRQMDHLHVDDIRVQMLYAGICGTDVHMLQTDPETGYVLCSAPADIPDHGRILGHEGVGRIIATGSNVNHLNTGDYVAFESIVVCHHCGPCRRGQFNQCHNAKLLGLEEDGLFGTVVDVPAMLAHNVSNLINTDADLRAMACLEPAGVAYVGCRNARIASGDVVVIFGAGPIGIYCAMLSKMIFGASQVHVIEPLLFRRNFAREWCDNVYDIEEFFDNPPLFVDVVVEASGHLENVNQMMRHVGANGRIVLLARTGKEFLIHAVDHMITNAISISGSRGHLGGAFSTLLKLYAERKLALNRLVTKVVEGPGGLLKIMESTEAILSHNCKVLVGFNEEDRFKIKV